MQKAQELMPTAYSWGYQAGLFFQKGHWPEIPTASNISQTLCSFPALYKEWWLNLYANDPVHVLVETTLLISILYILSSRRSKDWRETEKKKERLTPQEETELLVDWKENGRAPLTPPLHSHEEWDEDPADARVVSKIKGRTLELMDAPPPPPDENEKEDVEDPTRRGSSSPARKDTADNLAIPKTRTVLNFATMDFLGRSDSEHTKEAALRALDRYGCGACGPRGFYGTIDVHLKLERVFADHLGTDNAILYSDGASACSSTIAAFCKRGDLLVVDDAISEPLVTGITLSRAHVQWFQHNDMKDLRRVLDKIRQRDLQLGRKSNAQRRFLIVEGLYKNTGTVCPLDQVVELKHEFRYRLILDESCSFGTLGPTGRGVTELYKKKLMRDVEICTVSLENAVGSIGGLTVGSEEVVDHQRLSGSGYCFSASSPPFTASAAMASLSMMQEKPELLERLQSNQLHLHKELQTLCHDRMEDLLLITSDPRSPLILLQVADIPETKDLDEHVFLAEVVRECLEHGVAVVATGQSRGRVKAPPGIRFCVSSAHTTEDLDRAVEVLAKAVDVVMSRFHEETKP